MSHNQYRHLPKTRSSIVAIPPFFPCFHQPHPPQSPAVSSRHISVKGHMTPTPSRASYPRRSARASGTSENSHTPTAPSHYTPLHSQASLLRMRSASSTPRVEGVRTVALEEERRGVCQRAYTWRNKRVAGVERSNLLLDHHPLVAVLKSRRSRDEGWGWFFFSQGVVGNVAASKTLFIVCRNHSFAGGFKLSRRL